MKGIDRILFSFMILCLIGLFYSIYNIVRWKLDSINNIKQIKEVQKITNVKEIEDTNNTEIIEQAEDIPKNNPYFDYINMRLLNVDFKELKGINNDVKGWLQVSGTNINYPFVQTSDNNYYLTHSIDKSYNSAGWLFLDYRNDSTNNKNTIIYAHGRLDKTMFGTLKNVLAKNWLSNTNNYVIRISTEKENTLWQIFSIYPISTTNDYLQTNFNSNQEYQEFLDMLKNRSSYNFNTNITSDDVILTLSTCYNKTEKMVVHAKLIKKSVR